VTITQIADLLKNLSGTKKPINTGPSSLSYLLNMAKNHAQLVQGKKRG